MNKLYSPSSNTSVASSETSETQSVEENNSPGMGTPPITASGTEVNINRATKNWKRIKENNANVENENDSKKPPWRVVSISTLPKADKNALLRAKLLDASRRLRVARSSVATQTDFPSVKLMKEVNLDIQSDLIELKDVGILTDGSITLRKEGTGEFILTHSAANMTESIIASNATTQTLLPRWSGNGFFNVYFDQNQNSRTNSNDPASFPFTSKEKKLIKQIREIRNLGKNSNNYEKSCDSFSDDSLSDTDTKKSSSIKRQIRTAPNLLTPTQSSWYFNYDNIDNNANDQPFYSYTLKRGRPWSSVATSDIDNRFATMKLTPLIARIRRNRHQSATTMIEPFSYAHIDAIDDLIQESNKLIDLVHDIVMGMHLHRQAYNGIMSINPFESMQPIQFASKRWLPIIEKQEEELEKKIEDFEQLRRQKRVPLKNVEL